MAEPVVTETAPAAPPARVMGPDGRLVPNSVAIVAMGLSQFDYLIESSIMGGRAGVADEVWTINNLGGVLLSDRVFLMDDLLYFDDFWKGRNLPNPYRAWLKDFRGICYTSNPDPGLPCTSHYPLEDVVNTIGFPYLNTTVAYAVALAIHMGVKMIRFYGVDYTYPDRHAAESGRGCVEFLIALAVTRGIAVNIARSSTLLDMNVDEGKKFYGYLKDVRAVQNTDPAAVAAGKRWKIEVKDREPETAPVAADMHQVKILDPPYSVKKPPQFVATPPAETSPPLAAPPSADGAGLPATLPAVQPGSVRARRKARVAQPAAN